MSDIGPHLLGRVVSPPDPRDYQLSTFLADETSPLDLSLSKLLLSKSVAKATKEWAAVVTPLLKSIQPAPAPSPEPIPEPSPMDPVSWELTEEILDQENTTHCGGFAAAQWGNTLPIDDKFTNEDGHRFYYECKIFDGQEGLENGTTTRSVGKTLKKNGRLSSYAFSQSIDETVQWLLTKGPMIFGTDWFDRMFYPDENGVIAPEGPLAGGHLYISTGFNPKTETFEFVNSWSRGWGIDGHFYMHGADVEKLLSNQGEVLAAVELPVAS